MLEDQEGVRPTVAGMLEGKPLGCSFSVAQACVSEAAVIMALSVASRTRACSAGAFLRSCVLR